MNKLKKNHNLKKKMSSINKKKIHSYAHSNFQREEAKQNLFMMLSENSK
jgi:hypothetical protein